MRCTNEKEALARLKTQAKQMQAQHTRLKKQVIAEAQAVQSIDADLSQAYEEKKLRDEWLDREESKLQAEWETYELVLAEERKILNEERA